MYRSIPVFVGAATIALLAAACNLAFSRDTTQCDVDDDCAAFGVHPRCESGVCVSSGLGPEGCFFGEPERPEEFANQCSTAECGALDNCARINLCSAGDQLPDTVKPPIALASAADAGPLLADPPPCPITANTIVIAGSSAIQPFLEVIAGLLALGDTPYTIAYAPNGSCAGTKQVFSSVASERLLRGRTGFIFEGERDPVECLFADPGVPVDIAVSDVFSTTCDTANVVADPVVEYSGPIVPMTFVVPAASSETTISAELAYMVFGRGNTGGGTAPYTSPALYFIRNQSSGTQQMLARAIGVSALEWWGIDRGGSSAVRNGLLAVPAAQASAAIGILSSDVADKERGNLRILAFRDRGQTCAYYPDSTLNARDKRNVRDGHYPIWGPLHIYTRLTGGAPNAAATAFVNRVVPPRLDQALLDAITMGGLVPACAMTVERDAELGALAVSSPPSQCGCYFEAKINGAAPAGCTACNGPADCNGATPACNYGFCEAR